MNNLLWFVTNRHWKSTLFDPNWMPGYIPTNINCLPLFEAPVFWLGTYNIHQHCGQQPVSSCSLIYPSGISRKLLLASSTAVFFQHMHFIFALVMLSPRTQPLPPLPTWFPRLRFICTPVPNRIVPNKTSVNITVFQTENSVFDLLKSSAWSKTCFGYWCPSVGLQTSTK